MQRILKRFFDLVISLVLIIAFTPVMLVLCGLIYWRLGWPIFFRQTRIGRAEKPFTLIKFRTMREDGNASAELRNDAARLTPFGAWLRRSSLDELPELWNIIRGDMSVVGPRPLLPRYIPYYTPRERLRHAVRPGITGLAQISGRNALSWDTRLELDACYVEQFSFLNDLRILYRTLGVVMRREGINAEGQATMHALDAERQSATHHPC